MSLRTVTHIGHSQSLASSALSTPAATLKAQPPASTAASSAKQGAPDASSSRASSVGSLDRILSLAQASGHLTSEERMACLVADPEAVSASSSIPSLRHMHALSELARANSQIAEVDAAIYQCELNAKFAALLSPASLTSMTDSLEGLAAHLTGLVSAQAELTRRVLGPQQAHTIAVESAVQQHLVDLMPRIAALVANTSAHVATADRAWRLRLDEAVLAASVAGGEGLAHLLDCHAAMGEAHEALALLSGTAERRGV